MSESAPRLTAHGSYAPRDSVPPYSWWERFVIRAFHRVYYKRWHRGLQDTTALAWFGHHVIKCPLDLWIYQELIARLRPSLIVESGTCYGGSALYLASLCDLLGHGRVVTIDVEVDLYRAVRPEHPRLTYLTGSSTDPAIVAQVAAMAGPVPDALVILDSDHRRDHVLEELRIYRRFVPLGGYLIVEDSNVNGHPAYTKHGPGPWEAIVAFLSQTDEFVSDRGCERFMLTMNPRGYLRRVTTGTGDRSTAAPAT